MKSLIARIVEDVKVEDLVDSLMEVIMMIKRIRMRPIVEIKTKGEIIPIIFMTKIIEIREKEVEDKDLEEDSSVGNVFVVEKKRITLLNVPNDKEGKIEEQKARKELHMLMKMLDPHIPKILKEEKS